MVQGLMAGLMFTASVSYTQNSLYLCLLTATALRFFSFVFEMTQFTLNFLFENEADTM